LESGKQQQAQQIMDLSYAMVEHIEITAYGKKRKGKDLRFYPLWGYTRRLQSGNLAAGIKMSVKFFLYFYCSLVFLFDNRILAFFFCKPLSIAATLRVPNDWHCNAAVWLYTAHSLCFC